MGNCYGNIGIVYKDLINYPKALEYYIKQLKICEEIGDKKGLSNCYGSIATVYKDLSDYSKSLEYYLKALQLFEETNNKQGIATCYLNMGALYNDLLDYKLAIQYSHSCLRLSKEIGDVDDERLAYENLAYVYAKTNRYKEAYENHVKFKILTDSIFNADNSKQLGDMKTQFEVEKKEAELKVKAEAEQEKQLAVASAEKKKQQIVMLSVVGCLILVVVFSLFLFNRFRITQRQKNIIEQQKVRVDRAYEKLHEKNKEVMDSINYASRIQRALLPSVKYIESSLNRLMRN